MLFLDGDGGDPAADAAPAVGVVAVVGAAVGGDLVPIVGATRTYISSGLVDESVMPLLQELVEGNHFTESGFDFRRPRRIRRPPVIASQGRNIRTWLAWWVGETSDLSIRM